MSDQSKAKSWTIITKYTKGMRATNKRSIYCCRMLNNTIFKIGLKTSDILEIKHFESCEILNKNQLTKALKNRGQKLCTRLGFQSEHFSENKFDGF